MSNEELREINRCDGRITHGMHKTGAYKSWCNMKSRCDNPSSRKNRANYKDRGITYCAEWSKFEAFYSDMGNRPDGMSLERVDNNKGYSKSNCKWATTTEQNFNRRIQCNNTSGIKGVSYSKNRKKWRAYLSLGNRKVKWIGEYDTKAEAAAAKATAEAIRSLK